MHLPRILLLAATISASCSALADPELQMTSKMVGSNQLPSLGASQMVGGTSMRLLRSGTVDEERKWGIQKLDDILNNANVQTATFARWVDKKYMPADITKKIRNINNVDEKYLQISMLYATHRGKISSAMLPKVRYH